MCRQPFIFINALGLRRNLQLFSLRATSILMMLILSSCGSYEYVSDKFSTPIILKCPDYLVPAEVASVRKIRDAAGDDLVDVRYELNIEKVELGCISNIDKKTKLGSMELDATLKFSASLGPANPDYKVKFEYFISVVSPEQEILDRKAIPLTVNFPGNKSSLNFTSKPVYIKLQITAEKPVSYYRIFVGLRLTRDEVLYNRKKIMNQR